MADKTLVNASKNNETNSDVELSAGTNECVRRDFNASKALDNERSPISRSSRLSLAVTSTRLTASAWIMFNKGY